MSGAGYNGIDTLMEAEKEAAEIIKEARELRQTSVAKARETAQEEISSYRAELESEFAKKQQSTVGAGSQAEVKELTENTDRQIEALNRDFKEHSEEMLKLVVDTVLNVNPQIPEKMKRSN